jgi:hypothetical protein
VSIVAVHYVGVVGFLWCWLAAELFQMAFIVRLNIRLFAEVRALEFSYLRNLITICIASLVISFILLKRTAASPLLWQLGLSTTAGLFIAALSWHLFGLREVVKKMSSQFSRKMA